MRSIGRLVLIAVVAVAIAVASWQFLARTQTPPPAPQAVRFTPARELPDLQFIDMGGRAAKLSDWQGQVVLVFFGYTHCPDLCPLTLAQLASLVRDLAEPEDLQIIMVTVDPQRDTPARLRDYLGKFHPSFVGLTGSQTVLAAALRAFYGLSRPAEPGLVLHTDAIALLNRDGRVRALYGQSVLAEDRRFDEAARQALRAEVASLLATKGRTSGR